MFDLTCRKLQITDLSTYTEQLHFCSQTGIAIEYKEKLLISLEKIIFSEDED